MAGKITPELVGWQFIQQYYPRLNKEPERLYQFYNKASSLLHGCEDDTSSEVAHGQAEIRAKVSSENFKGCKVVVCSADSLESADSGVLVQVVGEISWPELQSQKFVQTFFLGKQESGYFVLNDILRILKDEPVPLPVSQPASLAPSEDVASKESSSAPVAGVALEPTSSAISESGRSAEPQLGASQPAPDASPISVAAPPTTLASNAPSNGDKPKTWANVVSQAGTPQNSSKAPRSSVPSAPATSPHGNHGTQRNGTRSGDQKQYSAYLRHVVPKVDPSELEAALKSLGKLVNIEIDSSKNRGFAHFADKSSLERALSRRQVIVSGETVFVETRNQRPKRT